MKGAYVLHFFDVDFHFLIYLLPISYYIRRHYFHHLHQLKAIGFYKNLILTQTFVMGLNIIKLYVEM